MPLLTGPVKFNGTNGNYSVIIERDHFDREIRIGPLVLWDAYRDGLYWQSDFGSPVYRRPAPFSIQEGKEWLSIWREVLTRVEQAGTDMSSIATGKWEVGSISGKTSVDFSNGVLTATTSSGNVTEYGSPRIQPSIQQTLQPATPDRLDFSLPFDLAIGVPRAKILLGDRPIQVMVDTGCDHSIFSSSLPHEELGVTVKVGGAGGIDELTLGRLRDVQWGETVLAEITPFFMSFDQMLRPMKLLRGIIGQDILARSEVTFDQGRGLITGRSTGNQDIEWPLDGPYTKAIVDDQEGWYRIDTGSAFTFHKFARKAPEGIRTSNDHHGIGGAMRVKPLKIRTLQLDEAHFANIQGFTHFTDDDPDVIAGNIGNQLLKDLEITMDFARGLGRFRSVK